MELFALSINWKDGFLGMCAIVAYWHGKRQIRFVKSETVKSVCADLESRGFTHIGIGGINYD